jgi:hypothetical protein
VIDDRNVNEVVANGYSGLPHGTSHFSACLVAPDRVVAAIDEVTAEAVLAAR